MCACVYMIQISDSTQKTAVLSFVNVEMGTDETALHFAAMARDYGAGSKKLKAHDNLLLQALRTSLGGNAHSFAVGELRADASAAANEMLVKVKATMREHMLRAKTLLTDVAIASSRLSRRWVKSKMLLLPASSKQILS